MGDGSEPEHGKRANVIAGTLFHEIGHTLGLTHGGLYYDTPGSYIPTFEANCKPNFQSIMNYLFQLDGVGPNASVAYSNQALTTLNCRPRLGSVTSAYGRLRTIPPRSRLRPGTFHAAWHIGASAATMHCDGTPLTGDTGLSRGWVDCAHPGRAWSTGQNITFDSIT